MVTNKEQNKLNVPHLRFPEFQGEWEKCKLGDIAEFSTARVSSAKLDCKNYVSTENMLQDFQGVVEAKSVPNDTNVISFTCGDILISNIRPYLKKVWKATFDGGCSSDVFVLHATDTVAKDYLHYAVANDKFINYVMSGAKGVKMPRGDKNQMRTYQLSLPSIQEQHKIAKLLTLLDERIATQSKLIEDLKKLKSAIIETSFLSEFSKKMEYFSPTIISGKDKNTDGSYPLYGSTGKIGTVSTPSYTTPMVLVARVGSIGTVQYINEPCGVTDNTLILQGDDVEYIYYFLSGFNFKKIISGTTQPLITASSLKAIDVPILNGHKKKALLAILKSLDKKINLESLVENEQRKLKLYILYQMFI